MRPVRLGAIGGSGPCGGRPYPRFVFSASGTSAAPPLDGVLVRVAGRYDGVREVLARILAGAGADVTDVGTGREAPPRDDVLVLVDDLDARARDALLRTASGAVLVTWFPEDERPRPGPPVRAVLEPGSILAGLVDAVATVRRRGGPAARSG